MSLSTPSPAWEQVRPDPWFAFAMRLSDLLGVALSPSPFREQLQHGIVEAAMDAARAADASQIAELKESEGRAIQVAGERRDRVYELEQEVAALSAQVDELRDALKRAEIDTFMGEAEKHRAELAQLRQQGAEKEKA